MIDNDAMLVKDAAAAWHKRGQDEGRAGCRATHGFLIDAARNEGYDAGMESTQGYVNDARARGEARGRWQGSVLALISMSILIGVAVWWRSK